MPLEDQLSPAYDDPNAQPAADPPRAPAEIFAAMPTDELRRARAALATHIPADPSWNAAVTRILSHLLDLNIAHPDRLKRDEHLTKAEFEARAKARADALAARQEAEKASATTDEDRAAIERRHREEEATLDRQHRLAALDAEQARERTEFAAEQRRKREEILNAEPAPPTDPIDQPFTGPVDERYPDPPPPRFRAPPVDRHA